MSATSQIKAGTIAVGDGAAIGRHSVIRADEVILGADVRIADNVEIVCDRLELGDGCRIGPDSTIIAPRIACGTSTATGAHLQVELNDSLEVGSFTQMGQRVTMRGQGFRGGAHVWIGDDIIVGGGACQGPRAYLIVGERSAVMNGCFINIAEQVSIGSHTALSHRVVLLTHAAWQPGFEGGTSLFAPIRIGSHAVVYINAVIMPGVDIGDYCTVAAGALVVRSVPERSVAVGNPARIHKAVPAYPRQLGDERKEAFIRSVLADYVATLPGKGIRAVLHADERGDRISADVGDTREVVRYLSIGRPTRPDEERADVTLSLAPVPPERAGRCHFDLSTLTMHGRPTGLSEDLRDYLRRRTIRIFTDSPFQSLPPGNIKRLREKSRGPA